jgi:hypothetical protein
VEELLQFPPVVTSFKAIVCPEQTLDAPVTAAGVALTVTVAVAVPHPVVNT